MSVEFIFLIFSLMGYSGELYLSKVELGGYIILREDYEDIVLFLLSESKCFGVFYLVGKGESFVWLIVVVKVVEVVLFCFSREIMFWIVVKIEIMFWLSLREFIIIF